MIRGRLLPSCLVAIGLSLLQTPQGALAGLFDVWLECPNIPGAYWKALPPSVMSPIPQPAGPRLAQPTAAPPSAKLPATVEKKTETKPAVAELPKSEATGKRPGAA